MSTNPNPSTQYLSWLASAPALATPRGVERARKFISVRQAKRKLKAEKALARAQRLAQTAFRKVFKSLSTRERTAIRDAAAAEAAT